MFLRILHLPRLLPLLLALAAFAAGCGGKDREIDSPLAARDGGRFRFLFVTPEPDAPELAPIREGMRDAAEALGVDCDFRGPETVDLEVMADMIRNAADEGYDGVAVRLLSPLALDAAVQEALDAGLPVVAFHEDDSQTPNPRMASVFQDPHEQGRVLAERARRFISPNTRVLVTMSAAGVPRLEARVNGIAEALRERGVEPAAVVLGKTPEEAALALRGVLLKHPDFRVVLGTGPADTEGAALAVERDFAELGLAVAGFGFTEEIGRLMRQGIVRFTIQEQLYAEGFYPVVQLTLYCRRRLVPQDMETGWRTVAPRAGR